VTVYWYAEILSAVAKERDIMKSMLSAVLGVLVLGLVAGCSDDSESVSCDFVVGTTHMQCWETSEMSEGQCTDSGGKVVDSCASGSVKSCTITQDGKSLKIYEYTDSAISMCAE
jgi:hypothetical protein